MQGFLPILPFFLALCFSFLTLKLFIHPGFRFVQQTLNNINNLWLKYSNGRFGFSVQKRIWQELNDGDNSLELEEKFGEQVGWYQEEDWIYYSDIHYSKTAPPGHLPIRLMLSPAMSNRCDINFEILEVILGRIYGRN